MASDEAKKASADRLTKINKRAKPAGALSPLHQEQERADSRELCGGLERSDTNERRTMASDETDEASEESRQGLTQGPILPISSESGDFSSPGPMIAQQHQDPSLA